MSDNFKSMIGFRAHYSQNTVPWHTEYFKLKEFKKTAEAGRFLPDLLHFQLHPQPLYPSPVKTGYRTFVQEVPSLYWEERSILIPKTKGL